MEGEKKDAVSKWTYTYRLVTRHVVVHNAYFAFKGHCFFSSKVPDMFESVIAFLDSVSLSTCQLYRLEKSLSVLRWVDVWVVGWMDTWVGRWVGGWVCEWMDG